MATMTRATPKIREAWGRQDAIAQQRQTPRGYPMPILQAEWPVWQRTHDVETAAARHFDRAYARGYVQGWQATDA